MYKKELVDGTYKYGVVVAMFPFLDEYYRHSFLDDLSQYMKKNEEPILGLCSLDITTPVELEKSFEQIVMVRLVSLSYGELTK